MANEVTINKGAPTFTIELDLESAAELAGLYGALPYNVDRPLQGVWLSLTRKLVDAGYQQNYMDAFRKYDAIIPELPDDEEDL